MADNKNMEINDEEMQNAAGGNILGLPLPKFKVGDHVRVKDYEKDDAVVSKVQHYTESSNLWFYEVHIFSNAGTLVHGRTPEDFLSPA